MHDGDLNPLEPVDQYLENNTDYIPTTPQDEVPHKDGLFGRVYQDEFNQNKLGDNVIATTQDGDHYDVIEQDPGTGNMYHDRIYQP